jgi:general stress protein 26
MTDSKTDGLTKLRALLKGARTCMLTTQDWQGDLRSRPMALQETETDGDLWFFTQRDSPKMNQIQSDHRVNVSVVHGNTYISISGTAEVVLDKKKAAELWNPLYKAWFPNGLDDPELALLKVEIDQAEYWDNPAGAMTTLIAYVKSLATGHPPEVGENKTVKL